MRVLLLLAFVFSPLPLQQPPHQPKQPSAPDQRGSQESPLVVKVLPAPKTAKETEQEIQERNTKARNDSNLVTFTGILALVGFLQLGVFGYQAYKLRQTVQSAGEQSQAMERHIGEASRSADAMETIARAIEHGNQAIIRAYLSVTIGIAVYQDRREGVKFEGKPNLVNTGSTPARNVKIRIAAEIVPYNEAETFAYAVPGEIAKAPAVAAPHQTYNLSAPVKDFVPDADVPDIKSGRGGKGALTVWGTVTYDDIFGQPHTTKFAQWLFWNPNQTVYGYYVPGQNDMD